MPKAYGYRRFSRPGQIQDNSLARQKKLPANYSTEHRLELDTTLNLGEMGVGGFKRHIIYEQNLAGTLRQPPAGTAVCRKSLG